MSTRLYPLYQKGNPQLRIFLPNFWMKLVRPSHKQPKNVTQVIFFFKFTMKNFIFCNSFCYVSQFLCSTEMTKHDIRNYLEKIYGVKCIDVRTRNVLGKFSKEPAAGYIKKEDDYKLAYVVLVRSHKYYYCHL